MRPIRIRYAILTLAVVAAAFGAGHALAGSHARRHAQETADLLPLAALLGNTGLTGATGTTGPAPTITVTVPGAHVAYHQERPVRADYTCTDAPGGPGIQSCVGSVADGGLLDTTFAGPNSFQVTATSFDGAVTATTVKFTVIPSHIVKVRYLKRDRHAVIQFRVTVPDPGTVAARARITGLAHPLLVRVPPVSPAHSVATVHVRPTPAERALLRAARASHTLGQVTAHITVLYTPTGGTVGRHPLRPIKLAG